MTERKKKLAICLCAAMILQVCTPVVPSAAVIPAVGASLSTNQAVQVVSTQAKLESALTKSSVRQIVIKTDKAVNFEIPKGSYTDKKLVIRAPKAGIKNGGTFKKVMIYSVSGQQGFVEHADHNRIRVLAMSGKIVVPAGVTLDLLTVEKKNNKVKVDVSGTVRQMDVKKASTLTMEVTGSIQRMNVNATSVVTMTGESKDTLIVVNKAAKDSRITVSAPATVKLKAAATVTLKRGAENAKLVVQKSGGKAVSYTLVNDTDSTLRLNTPSGVKTLAKGKSYNGKETGSSDTTVTGGGGSGGSGGGGASGGSGGPGGGGATKPEEPDKPAKKVLPAAVEMKDLHTFCIYVDAPEEINDLTAVLTPAAGTVTRSAVSTKPTAAYTKDGELQHIYGYCYTFTSTEAFQPDTEYAVSIGETDAYRFEEQRMDARTCEGSLKQYEDIFMNAFEGYCFTVKDETDENALVEKIDYSVEHSAPNSLLRAVYKQFEQDGITKQISIADTIIDEEICPVTVQLKKEDVVRTFICNMTFARENTEKGSLLRAKASLLRTPLNFDASCEYTLESIVVPYGTKVSKWESNNPSLINITDYTAEVILPKVGTEDVMLKAFLSQGEESVWIERKVTLDSGLRMPEYTVTIRREDTGALTASKTRADAPDGKTIENDHVTYQWYRMPVGSGTGAEEIPGATGGTYMPGNEKGAGDYWYYCKLISTYENQSNEFYSDFIRDTGSTNQ